MIIKQIEMFQKVSSLEAQNILSKETDGEYERIWTPHILLYVAGYSLGKFIDLIRGHTKNFSEKKELLEKLTKLNLKRNLIFHKSTSSYIDIKIIGEEFLVTAQECLEMLNRFTKQSKIIIA